MVIEIWIVVTFGVGKFDLNLHEGIIWSQGNTVYSDLAVRHTGVYICQNSVNYILLICHFTVYKLYLDNSDKTKQNKLFLKKLRNAVVSYSHPLTLLWDKPE
jgi:hypothetical protein